ncbi:MAG: hypothetical protein QGG25_00540, partial [Phycisphaerae bacterium]|nr:hypothetical protein [Phycisphaerae bacterium]
GPPELPPGAASYDQLVEMIEALDVSPADYDSFVAATMALGFNREDATYILDRMGAGRFRAVAEMNGAGRSVPDKRSDPIAYATYRKSPHRRKWWRFWEA